MNCLKFRISQMLIWLNMWRLARIFWFVGQDHATCVKDEGSNLASLTTTLISIVNCYPLKHITPFIDFCLRHVRSKVASYATNDSKVCGGLTKVNLKQAQVALQKTNTLTKKIAKGLQEWKNVYICVSFPTKILKTHVKTHFASQVIIFQKTFQYMDFISICYGW